MGKIPQYQRDKFVSSYVGAPQLDTEGMKIAESVGNAATNLAAIEAKRLGEQAQIRIDQQANNALLKYSLAYQQQAKDLQETYADNPGGYAEAVSSMGMSMQEEFQARIPDERIRARFGNAANTVIKAGQGVSLNWAAAKEEENALIAANETARLSTLQVGATTDLPMYRANLAVAKEQIRATPNIKYDEYMRENGPAMLEAHLQNTVRKNPDGTLEALESGVYDKEEYFDNDMKVKFQKLAESRIKERERVFKEQQADNYAEASAEFVNETLTFSKIEDLRMSEGITKPQANTLTKALANRTVKSAKALMTSEPKAAKYLELIDAMSDNRLDRVIKQEKVLQAFADTELMPEEERQLNELVAPLKDAKSALKRQNIIARASNVAQVVMGMAGVDKKIKGVFAVRDFLTRVRDGKQPEVAAQETISSVKIDRLQQRNIDVSSFPAEGRRIVDKNGKAIWVYPDGKIKEE